MLHKSLTGADIHVAHAFTYADSTARLAATVTAGDVGKFALQSDNGSFWLINGADPSAWVQVGTGAMPGSHTHAEGDITGLVADLAGKAAAVHTHDDRYYTETEVDTALLGKSDTDHTHDDRYFTEAEVTAALSGKSDTTHTHTLDSLSDVVAAGATDGQVLTVQGDGTFAFETPAAGGGTLDALSDVTITSPSSGQVLKYDGSGWVNGTDNTGGGGGSVSASVRQTVLAGRTDANGFANFLEAGTGLAVNLKATTVPVEITYASGFNTGPVDRFERITADVTGAWSGLAPSTTNYLYREYGVGYGSTTLVPVYGPTPTYVLQNSAPVMTSSNTPSPYVVSATSEYDGTYVAWKAFTGGVPTDTDAWASAVPPSVGSPQSLAIDLGTSPLAIYGYALTSRNYSDTENADPNTWTFWGSNVTSPNLATDADWTQLDSRSGETGWTSASRRQYLLPDGMSDSYRHFRIKVTANDGSVYYLAIGELELLTVASANPWYDKTAGVMKIWNGSAFAPRELVFVGEAVTDGSSVTSVKTYALQGRHYRKITTTNNTLNTFNHNIGVREITGHYIGRNIVNGDKVHGSFQAMYDANTRGATLVADSTTGASFTVHGEGYGLLYYKGGSNYLPTVPNVEYELFLDRGF